MVRSAAMPLRLDSGPSRHCRRCRFLSAANCHGDVEPTRDFAYIKTPKPMSAASPRGNALVSVVVRPPLRSVVAMSSNSPRVAGSDQRRRLLRI